MVLQMLIRTTFLLPTLVRLSGGVTATAMRDAVPRYGIAEAVQSLGPHPQLRRDSGKVSALARNGASWRETRKPGELQLS